MESLSYLLPQTFLIITGNSKEMWNTTGLNNLSRHSVTITVRYLSLCNLLIEVSEFITGGKYHYLWPPVSRNHRLAYHCHYPYMGGIENTPLSKDYIAFLYVLTLVSDILSFFPGIEDINRISLALRVLYTHNSIRAIRHRSTCHDPDSFTLVYRFVRHYTSTDITHDPQPDTIFL